MKLFILLTLFVSTLCFEDVADLEQHRNKPKCKSKDSIPVARTAFVDGTFGDDSIAKVEELGCPFKTIEAAVTAVTAVQGNSTWQIVIRPGNYVSSAPSGQITFPGRIEVVGSGTATTISSPVTFLGPGESAVRNLRIVSLTSIFTPLLVADQLTLHARNILIQAAVTGFERGVIVIIGDSTLDIDESRIEADQDTGAGIIVVRGNLFANDLTMRIRSTTEFNTAVIVDSPLSPIVFLRNSNIELSFPTSNTDGKVIKVRSGDDRIVSDNNVVTLFSDAPSETVVIYQGFPSTTGTLLSRVNTFRDGNNNIDSMINTPGGLIIDSNFDSYDVPV